MKKKSIKVLFVIFLSFFCILCMSEKGNAGEELKEDEIQGEAEEYDDSGYPGYYEYYNSKAEIENKCYVTQDGEVKFTVPDFKIEKVSLIIDNEPVMYIADMRNPNGDKVEVEAIKTDNCTYTAYELENPAKGEWKFQLDGDSWEKVNVYLIFYSKNKAAVSIEPELKDPDSGWYQAMIHLYDETGKNSLDLSGKKEESSTKEDEQKNDVQVNDDFDVKYNIYSQKQDKTLEYNFYLSDTEKKGSEKKGYYYLGGAIRPKNIENQESKEFSETERGSVIDNWTAQVVLSRKENGEKIVLNTEMVSSKEFKAEKNRDGIGIFKRIQKKSKEEKIKMALRLMAILLVIVGVMIVIWLWRSRKNFTKREKQKNYEDTQRAMEIAQGNLEYIKEFPTQCKQYETFVSKWTEWITYKWKYFQKDERKLMKEIQELQKNYALCQEKLEDWKPLVSKRDLSNSRKLKDLIIRFCKEIADIKKQMEEEIKVLEQLQEEIETLSQYEVQEDYKVILSYGANEKEKRMTKKKPGKGSTRGIQNLGDQALVRGTIASFCEMNDIKIGVIYYEYRMLLLISNKELKDGEGRILEEWKNEKKELLNFGQYKYIVEINGSLIKLENGAKIQFNII